MLRKVKKKQNLPLDPDLPQNLMSSMFIGFQANKSGRFLHNPANPHQEVQIKL